MQQQPIMEAITQGAPGQREFYPNQSDIRATRTILASLGLPTELILYTLDLARYWTRNIIEVSDHHVLMDEDWNLEYTAAYPYLLFPVSFSAEPDGEQPKLRELEFLIVSHDQAWTTEDTKGTYKTSSWFEVSQCRTDNPWSIPERSQYCNVEEARHIWGEWGATLLPRPSQEMEPQRCHCPEMMKVSWGDNNVEPKPDLDEGTHAWYLQGNEVARGIGVFEGEMVKRYHVVWGCAANPRWEGNKGAGRGEGFVDGLHDGDFILVWARAKVRLAIL